ncbi:MAG TPA: VTT domain-containing protein [Candidatus Sumerlaeota bacterium]|nr:VTT domain-containing protein [Candidatus Sumerlaeota bacterium]
MLDHLLEIVGTLADDPVKQAALAGFCTFILEDPTTIGCGLLVADHKMAFGTALVGLTTGITIGDLGLFIIGRLFGPFIERRKWISKARLEQARSVIDDNLFVAVLLSRFLPGTRIPTYVGAGMVRASVLKFLLATLAASLLWTVILLYLVSRIGEAVLPLLGDMKWGIVLTIVLCVLVYAYIRRRRRRTTDRMGDENVVSVFEFWHPALFYIPVAFHYAWLAIRFRSISLPSLANPSIYSGGICRESKSEILAMIPANHRDKVPPFLTHRKNGDESFDALLERMKQTGLVFPVVAKPDIGQRGAGVQRIPDAEALRKYITDFPGGIPIVIQELIAMPHEAGVLYYRRPGEETGHIMSLTLKELPCVTGDGERTLRQLIMAERRASIVAPMYFRRHTDALDKVLSKGEVFPLVFTGNHCQGAVFRDGTPLVTTALRDAFAAISDSMPEFYFGRFDVKYQDLESFLRGENFRVVEINGASAEATHIWDAKTKLTDAYRVLFHQFEILFLIGDENRRRGFKPIGGMAILKDFLQYRRTARNYPASS